MNQPLGKMLVRCASDISQAPASKYCCSSHSPEADQSPHRNCLLPQTEALESHTGRAQARTDGLSSIDGRQWASSCCSVIVIGGLCLVSPSPAGKPVPIGAKAHCLHFCQLAGNRYLGDIGEVNGFSHLPQAASA